MATVTAHAQEAVLEAAALEVGFEFLLNISRQGRAPCRQVLLERRVVFLNDLIEEGALRAVALIRRRIHTLAGFPASRQRQHDRIRARFCWPSEYQAQRNRCSPSPPAPNTKGLDFLDDRQFAQEREVLSGIRFADGELITHTDQRFMPRDRRDWTALNFQTDPGMDRVMFTVWINAVEAGMSTDDPPVLQTWNPVFPVQEDKVIDRTPLQRAVVHAGTEAVLQQMDRWHREPGRRVFYCGSWAYEGVPLLETAVQAARRVTGLAMERGEAA